MWFRGNGNCVVYVEFGIGAETEGGLTNEEFRFD
jgi:hypothetical protein